MKSNGDLDERLLSTGEAARALGIGRSTLTRWAKEGRAKPALVTAGGQYRWRLSELQRQLDWRPPQGDDEG